MQQLPGTIEQISYVMVEGRPENQNTTFNFKNNKLISWSQRLSQR